MTAKLTPRGLTRRLKRHLKGREQRFMASCAPGFEQLLAAEVKKLQGAGDLATFAGGVEFTGPLETLYHANLQLRTANRVLLRLKEFLAQSHPMLFDHARKLPWELFTGFAADAFIEVSTRKSRLLYPQQVARTVHDAMLARLGPLGLAPDLSQRSSLRFYARLYQDRCTLSVDTSGEHLHKRGYRLGRFPAPIRETLAAAILMAARIERHDLILDPMCGSGTLAIEAALLARRLPPGRLRSFAFESLPFHRHSKWLRFRAEAEAAAMARSPTAIVAGDIDPRAVEAAREGAERAAVRRDVTIETLDALALDLGAYAAQRPLLVSNLPYGRRLGDEAQGRSLHNRLASLLGPEASGWRYALITNRPHWLIEAGLRPAAQWSFRSGGLRVYLVTGAVPG